MEGLEKALDHINEAINSVNLWTIETEETQQIEMLLSVFADGFAGLQLAKVLIEEGVKTQKTLDQLEEMKHTDPAELTTEVVLDVLRNATDAAATLSRIFGKLRETKELNPVMNLLAVQFPDAKSLQNGQYFRDRIAGTNLTDEEPADNSKVKPNNDFNEKLKNMLGGMDISVS